MTVLHRHQDIFHFLFLAFRLCFCLCYSSKQPSSKQLCACFLTEMLWFLLRSKDNCWSDYSPRNGEPLAFMLALCWEARVLTSPLGLALPTALEATHCGSHTLWNGVPRPSTSSLSSPLLFYIRWGTPLFLFSYVAQNISITSLNTFPHQTKNAVIICIFPGRFFRFVFLILLG